MHLETTTHDAPGSGFDDKPGGVVRRADSPALHPWAPGDAPAYELKFLVDERLAREIEARLRPRLALDPHADPALGDAYQITTTYCDTPKYDVFHRVGFHRRRRYRLRRYGAEPGVFLERKTRHGERVWKRRSPIDGADLCLLSESRTDALWPGHWFHRQFVRRQLAPVCCVRYLRTAYVGIAADGPVRLTLDRNVRGWPANDWAGFARSQTTPLMDGRVVCEFKFRGAAPATFKGVIRELQLVPGGVSKYRSCAQAAGVVNGRSGPHA